MNDSANTHILIPAEPFGFVAKYILRQAEAEGLNVAVHVVGPTDDVSLLLDSIAPGPYLVAVSSTDVYGKEEGQGYNELTPTDPQSEQAQKLLDFETTVTDWGKRTGAKVCTLRCAPVVGTGMSGEMRRLASAIYRGTYHHIEGEEGRCSVVHAVDVARAALAVAGHDSVYNVTDGVNPTRRQLAEALAWRMGNKRIYTLRRKRAAVWARINDFLPFARFDSAQMQRQLSTLTFDSSRLWQAICSQPHPVADYLKEHNYDDDDF